MKLTDELLHDQDLVSEVDKTDADHVDFFYLRDTIDLLPDLIFSEDYVPAGETKSFCLHMEWIRNNKKNIVDRYIDIENMPVCENSLNHKFRWQANDPKNGVDFKVWKQIVKEVSSASQCSTN